MVRAIYIASSLCCALAGPCFKNAHHFSTYSRHRTVLHKRGKGEDAKFPVLLFFPSLGRRSAKVESSFHFSPLLPNYVGRIGQPKKERGKTKLFLPRMNSRFFARKEKKKSEMGHCRIYCLFQRNFRSFEVAPPSSVLKNGGN